MTQLADRHTGQQSRTPVRRRGETLRQAIYDATLAQLAEVGYIGLTMEGVAAAAGTGKAALYRRWSHKEDLVVDALDAGVPHSGRAPDRGSLREDLLAVVRSIAAFINSEAGGAMQAMMFEFKEADSAQAQAIAEIKHRVIERRRQQIFSVLRRGIQRGEVRPDALTERVVDVAPAMTLTCCMNFGPQIPDRELVAIVDEVLVPLVRA